MRKNTKVIKAIQTLIDFYIKEERFYIFSPFHTEMIVRLEKELERLSKDESS